MVMITLLTDFGLSDPYVAEMKGVVLSISPVVNLVDVSHGIERHNIAMGSFVLETALPYFPRGSIHVGVVDPGVGTERLPLVVKCRLGILVGPDNGLLVRVARRLGFESAYEIGRQGFGVERVSSTFHGRDIFARTAAMLANGLRPSAVGNRVKRLVELDIPNPKISDDGVKCTVLYVDSFGNVIVNLGPEDVRKSGLPKRAQIMIVARRRQFAGFVRETYSDIPRGRLGVLMGSQGYLEIAMRERNAAAKLGLRLLDRVEFRLS